MSRGLGPKQRAVLDACRSAVDPATGFHRWVTVEQVAPWPDAQRLPHAEREGWRRAMRSLSRRGLVETGNVNRSAPRGTGERLAARLPAGADQRRHEAEQLICNAHNWREIHDSIGSHA